MVVWLGAGGMRRGDRIRRRYPRTAARLYANLSEILADRVASTTERLR